MRSGVSGRWVRQGDRIVVDDVGPGASAAPAGTRSKQPGWEYNPAGLKTRLEGTAITTQELGSENALRPEFEFGDSESEVWESEINRSSADYIRWVQRSLNRILGLQLAVDGDARVKTRSAIRSFQTQRGLLSDGIVGSKTEAALLAALGGSLPVAQVRLSLHNPHLWWRPLDRPVEPDLEMLLGLLP